MLVARQNGKSTLMQVLSLWRMYVDGARLVIGTAQNLDIAEEVWQGAVDLAEEVPELAAEIARVDRQNGKKALHLVTGERYKVQTASRRGGRGLSGDLVLLDELREHQTWDAWGAITKTTMAREYAQIWAASNAGDASSVVLRYLRKLAHRELGDPDGICEADDEPGPGEELEGVDFADDSLGIFEWSAPPGCSVWDREGWAQANPSLGYTITERAIASAARTDPEWVFRTEVLCQWTDGSLEGPFPPGSWEACLDRDSQIAESSPIGACVDVSWDRSAAHIAYAGLRADGLPHVEIVASRAGTDWVVGWFTDPDHPDRATRRIAVQSSGAPASSLVDELLAAGLEVVEWKSTELGRATGAFYDLVRNHSLRHLEQPVLDVAAATAVTRPMGDSFVWDRRKSPTDVSPLVAATGAVWLILPKPKEPAKNPQVHEWPEDLLEEDVRWAL